MNRIYTTQNIPANQRAWYRQRQHPTLCRYSCGTKLVFMKNVLGNTVPCEARKIIEEKDGMKIMLESGEIKSLGKRFGWPVHDCLSSRMKKSNDEDIPLPEYEPINNTAAQSGIKS